MKILLATSEAAPFAKTGGLADVCGALPGELARLGHQPAVIMPAYQGVSLCGQPIEPLGIEFIVPIGSKTVAGRLLASTLPGTEVPIYLIEQAQYYDRKELYTEGDHDYVDNCERFVFFSRSVLEAIRLLELEVDILHANDWQTGLVPAYLAIDYRHAPRYQNIRSLFTIHNMGYQGKFWHWDMLLTGLDWKHFNWNQMECFGKLNLLKTGLVFSDAISTVSPRYSEEIQTMEFSYGLEGVLQHRSEVLHGILNGIDDREWNPATDPVLTANYDADSFSEGKPACKAALQELLGLPARPDVPVIGMIGRMTDQKGFDLAADVMETWVGSADVQWAVLGTGDSDLEGRFRKLADDCPHKVGAKITFSPELSHRVEAGSDMFLMPSRYEPCGLNQMYSLRYGTVPVVRRTGGLADTVVDTNEETLAAGTANGFSFQAPTAKALEESLRRACGTYRRPEVWRHVVDTGMRQDWSWRKSASRYVDLYQRILTSSHAAAFKP